MKVFAFKSRVCALQSFEATVVCRVGASAKIQTLNWSVWTPRPAAPGLLIEAASAIHICTWPIASGCCAGRRQREHAHALSVTVYVTLRIFGPTSYVRIFDRRSVTYGALRRRRSWRGGVGGASVVRARQAHQRAHQVKLDCPSRTTNVTTAYRLLHRSCSGRGTCVGNGAGSVIIALSQHSGLQQMRAQRGKFWGVEKCVRKL